ncbi:CRYZ [Symbiodinium necroappetens]|uniref:CRYZ protein n=1 Tax=Symbiodinium necroappetens TaxID=1628268 RepID=A0A813CD93_9DINO|nr:CRYZ [Symbiodinium necroappetens]
MSARIAAGLLLCLGVAQAESGVQGLVHWLEKNGPELADTAGHCVEAMSMAKSLSEKCQTTKFDPEGMAGLAAWAVLEGLEHMQAPMAQEFVNSSLAKFYKGQAIKMVQGWTHRSLKEFCDGDCLNGLESFDASYAKCYSSAICAAALSKEIPYDHCKKTMETFILRTMRIEQAMICSKSSMSDYFCAEERNTLLLQSPECYIRFMTPVLDERTCSAECVSQWSEAQSLHPGCSSFLQRQTQAVSTMTLWFMRELISGAKNPEMRKALDHLPKHFMTFQQAIVVERFGGPEVLSLSTKELPAISAGQVRVKVEASGVNPSDTYLRLGPTGPYAAVAPDVGNVRVGQRVYVCGTGTGTCATHMLCDAGGVHPLPDRVSFAQGACIGVPCATAYYALKCRAKVAEGQSVFIHGASGAVGLAAVQIAKSFGCRVVGSAGTDPGLAAVSAAGADAVVNHRESGYLEKCKEIQPGGYDVVLEMAAHANLAADLLLAGRRSRICIVGSKAEATSVNPRTLMPSEIDIRGVFLGSATPDEHAEIHRSLYDLMAGGNLAPVVSMQLPLSDAGMAHTEVMQPSAGGAAGNVVLLPWVESSL